MIVVYPFHQGDQEQALKNAQWIADLRGCKGHEVLAITDPRCTITAIITDVLQQSFDKLHLIVTPQLMDGWPQGANFFFRYAATRLETKPDTKCFFWMEPDAIPLKPGWLDAIAAEYATCKRPFMGDRVQVKIEGKEVPLHMSGVGVYPLPLHAHAGEAYRAHDTAWDMAAKDQIVPNAHFTKLIEHAWKHPTFTDPNELKTQIRPECVLFHSSKDGSLIDLLRGSSTQSSRLIADRSAVQVGGPAPNGLSGREVGATSLPPKPQSEVHAGSSPVQAATPTCDIFIRTYPGDYQWLGYCMRSIRKFCTGFRKIWIVSPQPPIFDFAIGEWKVLNEESEDHYLSQQIHKLYADVITDYQADYILHVDSDVIFNRPCSPQDFLWDDKIIWYYTSYDAIQTPWKPITEKFIGGQVSYEYMRRFPMIVPRWLYPRIREFCHKQHGVVISDYIRVQPPRAFSEFNALGAYAFKYHHDMFHWVDTINNPPPEPFAKQYHSWGGITPEIRTEIEAFLGNGELASPLSSNCDVNAVPQSTIRVLPGGFWVIDGDDNNHMIETQQRLDVETTVLPFVLHHIKPGDTVVDGGAFIGDHTIAYLRKVGPQGKVYAFEPNPDAMTCLVANLAPDNGSLATYQSALGDEEKSRVPFFVPGTNFQGAFVARPGDEVAFHAPMMTLDSIGISPQVVKLDLEGGEFAALKGMVQTIERSHPVFVIEMSAYKDEIWDFLQQRGYEVTILQEGHARENYRYDIVALPPKDVSVAQPKKSPEDTIPAATAVKSAELLTRCYSAPPPVTPSIHDMLNAVILLKKFAEVDTNHRQRLMINLAKSGLTPRWPKRKKKK